jgi:hypothetical protein
VSHTPEITFDSWLEQASASIPALERDLHAQQNSFAHKMKEFERLGRDLEVLDKAIEQRKRVLGVLREIHPEQAIQPPLPAGDAQAAQVAPITTMSKREMAERILRGRGTPLFPRQVREIAVERGWLPDTAAAANQLSVAMNKAARQQHLVRDEEGRYSLPSSSRDDEDQT